MFKLEDKKGQYVILPDSLNNLIEKEMEALKKWSLYLGVFALIIGLLLGCASDTEEGSNTRVSTNDSGELAEDEVRITISINEGEEYVGEEAVSIEEGDILLEVLQDNFYVETDQGGQFITSIERVEANDEDQTAWMYTVNGEMAQVGAGDYELSPGDKVVFDLQSWE